MASYTNQLGGISISSIWTSSGASIGWGMKIFDISNISTNITICRIDRARRTPDRTRLTFS